MDFCLCIDLDGFYVGNHFVVRELGWYAPLSDTEAFGVYSFTHEYTWDQLTPAEQRRVNFVKHRITGLTFRPSPQEFRLRGDLPGQADVPRLVERLWHHYKTPACNRVAYKGGTVELNLLTLLAIPSMDLEQYGCPTFNKLSPHFDYPRCSCHVHEHGHCAMSECYVFSHWWTR